MYRAAADAAAGTRPERSGRAIAWLERGLEERDPKMVFLNVEPQWSKPRALRIENRRGPFENLDAVEVPTVEVPRHHRRSGDADAVEEQGDRTATESSDAVMPGLPGTLADVTAGTLFSASIVVLRPRSWASANVTTLTVAGVSRAVRPRRLAVPVGASSNAPAATPRTDTDSAAVRAPSVKSAVALVPDSSTVVVTGLKPMCSARRVYRPEVSPSM